MKPSVAIETNDEMGTSGVVASLTAQKNSICANGLFLVRLLQWVVFLDA